MHDDSLFRIVELPYCQALMLEEWNAAPGRFFVAYRARHGFTSMLGHGVVDEFRTISGPVLLAPAAIIGGIYDTGMRLADLRDVEAPIDQGWPPLTIGIDVGPQRKPADWRKQMLRAIRENTSAGSAGWDSRRREVSIDGVKLQSVQCSVAARAAATIVVTDAPMLPEQLARLADTDGAPITVAVSTGNRLPRLQDGELHDVGAVSESRLDAVVRSLEKLLRA